MHQYCEIFANVKTFTYWFPICYFVFISRPVSTECHFKIAKFQI